MATLLENLSAHAKGQGLTADQILYQIDCCASEIRAELITKPTSIQK